MCIIKQGDAINLDTQISYFAKTRRNIISNIGDKAAKALLTGAIYVVATGANDIVSIPETHQDASINIIISRLKSQLKVKIGFKNHYAETPSLIIN